MIMRIQMDKVNVYAGVGRHTIHTRPDVLPQKCERPNNTWEAEKQREKEKSANLIASADTSNEVSQQVLPRARSGYAVPFRTFRLQPRTAWSWKTRGR